MKRRTFVHGLGLGVAGAMIGLPRTAQAAWGDVPASVWATATPAQKVLEIHLAGGMAPWESFYYRPAAGSTTRGFDPEVSGLVWNGDPTCSGGPSGLVSQFLANDAKGKPVHLGPFARPLWRSDISSRMRVVVMRHNFPPHEAAIPYALAGHQLGRANFCGLGVPVQRRARDLDAAHALPWSYCLVPPSAATNPVFAALDTIGNHPGNAKPVKITIGPGAAGFLASLDRPMPDGADGLIDQYRAQYAGWLMVPGPGAQTRSRAFEDYASSVANLFKAPQLKTLLNGLTFTPGTAPFCSREASEAGFLSGNNFAGTAIRAAAHLLTRTGLDEARYVGIIDGGLQDNVLPYDVHEVFQARRTSSNLWDTLSSLAAVIRNPAAPSPDDANKIDLDTTVIVIKTEFGRTPYRSQGGAPNLGSDGRDHWTEGFAHVIIGGPIHTAGVVGSIADGPVPDPGTGLPSAAGPAGRAERGAPVDFFHKTEDNQCAVLLAAGIDPFADGNFQLGELSPRLQAGSHLDSAIKIRQIILGVP